MKFDRSDDKSKKPYEKPTLRTIELAAEEVMAVGCKTITGGGGAPTATPCDVGACTINGS